MTRRQRQAAKARRRTISWSRPCPVSNGVSMTSIRSASSVASSRSPADCEPVLSLIDGVISSGRARRGRASEQTRHKAQQAARDTQEYGSERARATSERAARTWTTSDERKRDPKQRVKRDKRLRRTARTRRRARSQRECRPRQC